MTWKKIAKRIILPVSVVLFTVTVVAQITTGKNIWRNLISGTDEKKEIVQEDTGDDRKVTGDDPWKELEKIYEIFNQGKNVSYSGKIKLQEEDADKMLEETSYSCEVNDGNYHYSIDSVEMIYNREISLNIYHRERIMILGRGKQTVKNWWTFSSIDSVRKYAMLDSAEVKVKQDGTLKLISVENNGNPDVYAYEIYYDPYTYRLTRLVMFFTSLQDINGEGEAATDETDVTLPENEEDSQAGNAIYFNTYRMELTYDNFSVREGRKDFAPESRYIRIDKKKILINDQYKGYRIIVPDTEEKK
jgi:hypothetical protein